LTRLSPSLAQADIGFIHDHLSAASALVPVPFFRAFSLGCVGILGFGQGMDQTLIPVSSSQPASVAASPAPTLVVLAAGMGSRYGGLKQVDPMGPRGEALLDYSVFDAKRAGFGRVVFVIRRDFEELFKTQVVSRFDPHLDIALAYQSLDDVPAGATPHPERTKPWGTAHATLAARHVVHEPFCVINADDFYGPQSYEAMAAFLTSPERVTTRCRNAMCGFTMRQTLSEHGSVARGVCEVESTEMGALRLRRVEEMTQLVPVGGGAENRPPEGPVSAFTGDEYVSMNMWGFTPSLFASFEAVFAEFLRTRGADPKAEFYIPAALDQLLQSGEEECHVLPTPARWFGVTYQADRPVVQQCLADLHAQGLYPDRLWA
jgi:MobA-like NTP transferase domain